jgi:hypothetical protein
MTSLNKDEEWIKEFDELFIKKERVDSSDIVAGKTKPNFCERPQRLTLSGSLFNNIDEYEKIKNFICKVRNTTEKEVVERVRNVVEYFRYLARFGNNDELEPSYEMALEGILEYLSPQSEETN